MFFNIDTVPEAEFLALGKGWTETTIVFGL